MLGYEIKEYEEIIMIGKVFRKNGINMIYGESGVGKTISTVKALNTDSIVPILLDFDNNDSPDSQEVQFVHIDGDKYIKNIDTSRTPTGEVIIIDTWQMFINSGGDMDIVNRILHAGNTVIIIAHSKDIATKRDIPDIEEKYSNNFSGKLYLEHIKGTSRTPEAYNLVIKKLRGYVGAKTIENWMRGSDTMVTNLLKEM